MEDALKKGGKMTVKNLNRKQENAANIQLSESIITAGVAKTAFRELLDRVESGEQIVIQRHGKPVAEIGPVRKPKSD
jgi:prevent-host-death family protein